MDQEIKDYFLKRISQMLDGIDRGDFSGDVIPDKYTWEHMFALFMMKDDLDGGRELFKELHGLVTAKAENALKLKAKAGNKIRVAFQSYSAAQWPAESVYRQFESTDGYEVHVVVTPLADRDKESMLNTYSQTLSWFKNNGYNVAEGIDPETNKYVGWESFGEFPDVLYLLSSWFESLPNELWFTKLPLRCLTAYIPYGIHLEDDKGGNYKEELVYNKEIINLMWRVYCDSLYNLEKYKEYQLIGGANVRYSGYAKMDYFAHEKSWDDEALALLWKTPSGIDIKSIKKVIIAPHYSLSDKGFLLWSTFRKNCWFLLYLAQKYKNEVSFIFKPHPNLRHETVKTGTFKSYEDYDAYIDKWNELPNAKVVTEASYLDHFATSDAMIMDSISFLGEYLYTGKPLLFLRRPEQTLTEIGNRLIEAYYKINGEDYIGIEDFLCNVVIKGEDTMKHKRNDVYIQDYDYMTINGVPASEIICNDVFEVTNK